MNRWYLLIEMSPNNILPLSHSCIFYFVYVILWFVSRDFRYRGSIKDAVSLKHREAEKEEEAERKAEAEREAERQLWKDVGQ